jgi:hypothetical protein
MATVSSIVGCNGPFKTTTSPETLLGSSNGLFGVAQITSRQPIATPMKYGIKPHKKHFFPITVDSDQMVIKHIVAKAAEPEQF